MHMVSFELIKYIQGELPTLDEIKVTIDGESRPFLINEKRII